jgi:hypothetical protein
MITIKENQLCDVRGNARQPNGEQDNACSNLNMIKLQSFFIKKNKNKKYKNKNMNEKIDLDEQLFKYKNIKVEEYIYGEFDNLSEDLYGVFVQSGFISFLPNSTLPEKRKSLSQLMNSLPNELYQNIHSYLFVPKLYVHTNLHTFESKNLLAYQCIHTVLREQFDFEKPQLLHKVLIGTYHDYMNINYFVEFEPNLIFMIANLVYPHFNLLYDIRHYSRLHVQSGEEDFEIIDVDEDSDDLLQEHEPWNPCNFSTIIPEHYQRKCYIPKLKKNEEYYINKFGDIVIYRVKEKLTPQSGNFIYRMRKMKEQHELSQKVFNERYIIKLIDDIVNFIKYATETVIGMSRYAIIVRACTNFLKLRLNESTYHTIKDTALPYIKQLISTIEIQSFESKLEETRQMLSGMKNIFQSPIMTKLHQCCLYMISLSLFENMGIKMDFLRYSALEKAALKRKYSNVSDFFYVLCDTILFVVERGYQVFKTGDIQTIFHSGGQYKAIYDLCRELERKQHLLTNPEEHGFTESGFRSDLDNVIEKLTSVNKYTYLLNSQEKHIVKETFNKMSMMRDDLNTRTAARKNRKAPLGLLIYGDSGIGKTSVTSILATYFAKHENLPIGAEFRYTVNPAAKYWDGFVSSCHTLILDDVANEHPDLKDSKSLDNIIQVMNNQAFCPDQASLEAKGNTPFKGKLVIATTNVKTLNAYAYFSCPSAAQRRFPYIITPKPRKEYRDERGMLSTKNAPQDVYPDLWEFDIDLVIPVPASKGRVYAKMERIETDLNMRDMLLWFHKTIESFNDDQKKIEQSLNRMEKEELCMCCNLPDSLCSLAVQSGVETTLCIIVWFMILYTTNFLFIRTYYETYLKLKNLGNSYYKARDNIFENLDKISTSSCWFNMGEKIKSSFGFVKILTAIAASVTIALALRSMTHTISTQGNISEKIGTIPKKEENGRENVWYNNDFELCPANFTRESASSKSVTFEKFQEKIFENVIFVGVKKENSYQTGKLLGLGGHIYMTNNHNIPQCGNGRECKLISSSKIGLNSNMDILLSESDILRYPDKDLAFITIRELPPKKKIIQYFMTKMDKGVFNGVYLSRDSSGRQIKYDLKNISFISDRNYNFPKEGINATIPLWCGITDVETQYGDCGSPMIVNSDFGYAILGIHLFLNLKGKTQVMANAVDGFFLNEIYTKLSPFNTQGGDLSLINTDSIKRPVVDLHKKSVFRYINNGCVDVYGSFTDFRGKQKSKVTNTPMSKVMPSSYRIKYTSPEMTSYVPWRISALDIVKPVKLSSSLLNLCSNGYYDDVLSKINLDDVKNMLIVLDDFTTLNGAQVAYIDKVNRKSSAGNPWKKSKKYFLESIAPDHGMLDPVKISNEEINDRIDQIILTYQKGERCNPNFCAHLKDEPVTFKKAKIGKTRVFTGAPFDWCFVVRKYLLSFCRLLQNNRFAFEAAPGTVAQSLEWQEIYHHITKHGEDRIVAGDYKAYDKRMSPKEILAAFDIIIRLCELSGNYTDMDIKVIRGIAEDTAFAIVDYNGDLIQLYGSNPSGNPLTVILNSIVNSLRMRYVYFILNPNHEIGSFTANVALMTYGDDNIMSVNKSIDWFNHTNIANCFEELEIVYTMADKEAESVPFINISDASFLKRSWKFDKDMNCFLGPLDHDSIEKMLMVWVKSKAVTEEHQGISVIQTAMQEYFFYGKDIFEEKREMLLKVVNKLAWQDYINEDTFPTYGDLCLRYKKSSSKCFSFEQNFGVQSGTCLFNEVPMFENLINMKSEHNNGTPFDDPTVVRKLIFYVVTFFILKFYINFCLLGFIFERLVIYFSNNVRKVLYKKKFSVRKIVFAYTLLELFTIIEYWIVIIVILYMTIQMKRSFYLFFNSQRWKGQYISI